LQRTALRAAAEHQVVRPTGTEDGDLAKDKGTKTCFVIAPIGAEGSDVRVRSDQVLKHIISPAARECGYDTVRADQISEPGLITSQIIQHVVEDPLVIADLTGRNPNVFYELALRHAIKKPVVQIIHATENIPFDIAASRTVHVDHHDLDSVARAKEEIVRQVKAVEANPSEIDTPISVAIELQSLRQSDNPLEKSNAEILVILQQISTAVTELRDDPRRPKPHPGMLEELAFMFGRVNAAFAALELEDGKPVSAAQIEELRRWNHRSGMLVEQLCVESGLPPGIFRRRFRPREEAPAKKE
jgi:hypothetical protein